MRNDGILRHIESTLDNEVETIDTLPEFEPTSKFSIPILLGYMIIYDLTFPVFEELIESAFHKIKSSTCRFNF